MKIKSMVAVVAMSTALVACKTGSGSDSADAKLDTEQQKFSYGMGLQIGKMAKNQGVELDMLAYKAGLIDGMHGSEQRLSDEELQTVFTEYQKTVMEKREKDRLAEGSTNAEKGKAFLAENGAKEGVKTTKSGLQYKVIKEGAGAKPTTKDTVKVHYKGTLIDGTEFDSSYSRNEPISFPLGGVIQGWQEGLTLMTKGSKYELYIPAELAYGEGGAGKIGPNATLIFEVELLDINPEDAKAKKPAEKQEPAKK
ncbi:MAG: FKBP-type peptidyl-prolyl cis-trans isomerase [Pseudomonadota bacterium]